jgi:hypothetical protein
LNGEYLVVIENVHHEHFTTARGTPPVVTDWWEPCDRLVGTVHRNVTLRQLRAVQDALTAHAPAPRSRGAGYCIEINA